MPLTDQFGRTVEMAPIGASMPARAAGAPAVVKGEAIGTSVLQAKFGGGDGAGAAKLGTLKGVYFPCTQNILGIILFLRLPWIVGQAGVLEAFFVVFLCCSVTFLTALSQSAIATNGQVPAGGSYYMISRALGPEFGGAVGLLFFLGTTSAATLYVLGAVETATTSISGLTLDEGTYADNAVFGTILLALMVLLVYVGVKAVSKIAPVFLAIVVLCILLILVGLFAASGPSNPDAPGFDGITGLSSSTFDDNADSAYEKGESFSSLVALFFPSVTGIMAGSNRSGDLASPQVSIPRGTLGAQLTTATIYLSFVLFFGAVAVREKLLDLDEIVVAEVAWPAPEVVQVGVFLSSVGAGLQSLTGAPRLLFAVANDHLMPILEPFSVTTADGEPRRALLLTWLIAGLLTLVGDLDSVAPILTMFFLICYAFVNLATFLLTFLRAPNFRPSWKYYHWSTSLLGFVLCLVVMFLISWWSALITFLLSAVIYKYIEWKRQETNWGDGLRGLKFQAAKNALVDLDKMSEHTKNWRPHVLLIARLHKEASTGQYEADYPATFRLIRHLEYGRGLTIASCVVQGAFREMAGEREVARASLRKILSDERIEGFHDAVVAPTWTEGAKSLLQLEGLGQLVPNTVIVTWPEQEHPSHYANDFVELLRDTHAANKAFLALKNSLAYPIDELARTGTIDVWWVIYDGGMLLQLALLLKRHRVWRGCALRVFAFSSAEDEDSADLERQLLKVLNDLRIPADVSVFDLAHEDISLYTHARTLSIAERGQLSMQLAAESSGPPLAAHGHHARSDSIFEPHTAARISKRMREESGDAALVVTNLPTPSPRMSPREYTEYLETLTAGLPATLMVHNPAFLEVITVFS